MSNGSESSSASGSSRRSDERRRRRARALVTTYVDRADVIIYTEVGMDAKLDRDEQLKQWRSQIRQPEQTWYEWFWGIKKAQPAQAIDAATSESIKNAFTQMLDQTDPPETFKPSEVALQLSDKQLADLGYKKWEECLPGIYMLAFEEREFGNCVILRKGKVLGDDVTLADIDGPIRIGRAD